MSIKSAQISNILGLAERSPPAPAAPDATEHRDLSLPAHEEGFSNFHFFPPLFLFFFLQVSALILLDRFFFFLSFLVGNFICRI